MLVQLWFALSAVLLQTLMFCFMGHCWMQDCRLTSWLQNSDFHFPALLVAASFLSTVCCCPVLPLGTLGSSPPRTSASKEQELSVGRGLWSLHLGKSCGAKRMLGAEYEMERKPVSWLVAGGQVGWWRLFSPHTFPWSIFFFLLLPSLSLHSCLLESCIFLFALRGPLIRQYVNKHYLA